MDSKGKNILLSGLHTGFFSGGGGGGGGGGRDLYFVCMCMRHCYAYTNAVITNDIFLLVYVILILCCIHNSIVL